MHVKKWLTNKFTGAGASGLQKSEARTTVGTRNEATREAWLEHCLGQIPDGLRILDAGAGEQRYKRFCSHLNYVAQDFAEYDGKGDGVGLQTGSWDQSKLDIVCDITSIPESDASFDAIMCVEVFEHLPNPILAIKEFSRLLKKKGTLIITAPFCSLTHLAPYHFYSGFNHYFYKTHLPMYGFEITDLQENGNFFEYLAQEIHRLPYIAESYAKDCPNGRESLSLQSVLAMLERFSSKDNGSAEMLYFGCHVRASRK